MVIDGWLDGWSELTEMAEERDEERWGERGETERGQVRGGFSGPQTGKSNHSLHLAFVPPRPITLDSNALLTD